VKLERTELSWRIKKRESVRTYHAFAMYPMEKSTAGMPVVTREAKTWRSRVSATIRHVRLRFGKVSFAVPLTWSIDNELITKDLAAPGFAR
jgi:hypothetical protein